MKKKLLAVWLIFILAAGSFCTAAADQTLKDLFRSNNIPETASIEVPANIALQKEGQAGFTEGPVSLTVKEVSAIPKFNFSATMYMDEVRKAFNRYMLIGSTLCGDDEALLNELANTKVTGHFTIRITYPREFVLPSNFTIEKAMVGFNSGAGAIFREDSRRVITSGNNRIMVIEMSIAGTEASGRPGYITAGELQAGLSDYLGDLSLTCNGVKINDFGTFTISGEVTGTTVFGDTENPIATINYTAKQTGNATKLSETIEVKKSTTSAGGGGGSAPTTNQVQLSFNIPGFQGQINPIVQGSGASININDIKAPVRPGSVFAGWYYDAACTKLATGTITITENTVLYGKFVNVTAPSVLNSEEHMAYVLGYPEGDIRPESNITREEIATIFYRLLKDDKRNEIFSESNNFSDVESDRWSNTAISTMAKGGYIEGYENGSFAPAVPITRAEFVTIASRFADAAGDGSNVEFSDISGHWAEVNIKYVAANSWINGYDDGTFRPDKYITRAEAITIINKMMVRYADAESIAPGAKQWNDNLPTAWYYYQILEATNSHAFTRREDGYNENWTKILENKEWTER